jgi:hypothetical protein
MLDNIVKSLAGNVLDYGIETAGEIGTYIFRTRPLWGIDRRVSNSVTPVVFDQDTGNMSIPILSESIKEQKTVMYVGGAGGGVNRIVERVLNDTAITAHPYAWREDFMDARKQDSVQALKTEGRSALYDKRERVAFTFNVRQVETSYWPKHYGLGDYTTAVYEGLTFDKQIQEISVKVTSAQENPETINVEMRDSFYVVD